MIRFILLLAVSVCSLHLTAQTEMAMAFSPDSQAITTTEATPVAKAVAFRAAPLFPAASGSFKDFISKHLEYPEVAVDYAVEGTVVLQVEVTPTGKVKYLRTARPLFAPLDEAAIATIDKLPTFLPAVRDGKAVSQTMMIPIRFTLR